MDEELIGGNELHLAQQQAGKAGDPGLAPVSDASDESVAAALKDIKLAIQATRVLQHQTRIPISDSYHFIPCSSSLTSSIQNNKPDISGGGESTTAILVTGNSVTTAACRVSSNRPIVSLAAAGVASTLATSASREESIGREPWLASTAFQQAQSGGGQANGTAFNFGGGPERKPAPGSGGAHPLEGLPVVPTSGVLLSKSGIGQPLPPVPPPISTIPTSISSGCGRGSQLAAVSGAMSDISVFMPPPPMPGEMMVEKDNVVDIDEENVEEDDEMLDEEDDDDDDIEEDESESEIVEERVPTPKNIRDDEDLDTDQETDRLLGQQYNDDNGYFDSKVSFSCPFPLPVWSHTNDKSVRKCPCLNQLIIVLK